MRKLLIIIFCLNVFVVTKQVAAESGKTVDIVLIGGGIMSATLGTYIQQLEPHWSIDMFERLDRVASESSNGWNNAGTGHSALAEMNYTPEKADGSIEIVKAIEINEAFQISRQFWTYQVKNNVLHNPRSFINSVPHMSFVWGRITLISCVNVMLRCNKVLYSTVWNIQKTQSKSRNGYLW